MVHVFTASGAGLAFLALIAAVRGDWPLMFLLLGIALVVDGVDGTLARALKVSAVLPNWSGAALDFVVDFVTYVFVPAYAISASGVLPPAAAVPAGLAIVVSAALYFCDIRMKTADNHFRGFPVLWNAAAFYLFLLKPAPWVAAALVAALVVLTFVPFKFVHPIRVVRLRLFNIVLLAAWGVLAIIAIARELEPGPAITTALAGIGIYYLSAGLLGSRASHAARDPAARP